MRNILLLVMLVSLMTGCARNARLYPANEKATPGGVLTARFMDYGTGNGKIEITMPDKEILKGEYSVVTGGAIGFGTIYGSVYGSGGSASVSGVSNSYVIPGGSRGMASLFGDKGTSMECEFVNDNWTSHGHGACKASTGAMYRLQY